MKTVFEKRKRLKYFGEKGQMNNDNNCFLIFWSLCQRVTDFAIAQDKNDK